MQLQRSASCGSTEASDALVQLSPADGLEVSVASKSGPMYEDQILSVVRETLARLGVGAASVEVREGGAYDHVILARLEGALVRACGMDEVFLHPLPPGALREGSPRERLRRSRLYVPGSNARSLAFADTFGADCLIFDLEDAVAPSEKDAARFLVRRVLAAMGFSDTELWVRVNPLERGGSEDLKVTLGGRPHGVCLPKTETPAQVSELAGLLYELEGRYELPWRLWIMPIIESPRGVLAAFDIARASERVVTLAFGAEDYTREVGCARDGESLLWARSGLAAAAKAAGVQASDSVWSDLEDEAGLRAETRHVRNLGFDGKGVIHPLQIEPVHACFAPSAEELRWASGVVAAAEQGRRQGWGVVSFEGRMVDRPVLLRAERLLAMGRAMGMEVPNAA